MTFGRGLRAGLMGFRALVVAALVAYAGLPEDAAQAGPLIQNGSFEQTSNISSPGGYICGNGAGDTCISNLLDWTSTCAPGQACGGSQGHHLMVRRPG